jgi:hypothetical protein
VEEPAQVTLFRNDLAVIRLGATARLVPFHLAIRPPTATHDLDPGHETASSAPGEPTDCQRRPFHSKAMRPYSDPIAIQKLADGHDTPCSAPALPSPLGTSAIAVPLHCSAALLFPALSEMPPTPAQKVAEAHETAFIVPV